MRSKHGSQGSPIAGGPAGAAGGVPARLATSLELERGSILTAPPFGFSPELPLSRPGGPTARPAPSVPGAIPGGIPDGIRDSLRRLRGQHLRLSLCRIRLRQGSDGRLAGIDDPSLIAEPTPDGALYVIFIHPPGVDDDRMAEQVLWQRLALGFQRSGLATWALRVAATHYDAAAIDDGTAIFETLLDLPLRPLRSLGLPI